MALAGGLRDSPLLLELASGGEDAGGGLSAIQARSRVRRVALALVAALCVGGLLDLLYYSVLEWAPPPRLAQDRLRLLGLLALSLPMVGIASWRRVPAERVVDLCLVYQVCGALVCSLSFYGQAPILSSDLSGVTWLGVWILLFPLVAPAGIARSSAASFLAATTAPLVYLGGLWAREEGLAPASVLATTFVPNYFCAGLALFPSLLLGSLSARAAVAEASVRKLGTYRLVEKLGQGGMSEVWRAEHELLRRPAAIKLISPERLSGSAEGLERLAARFEREANAIAGLKNAHTVELYDFGVTREGSIYLVIELLAGIDLEKYLERYGPLEARRVVPILRQVAESLAEAHAVGMVHRDLKPANVFLCRHGLDVDFVKVLDFGLVALGEVEDARLTAEGVVMGTPAYLAPELLEAEPTPQADVYGLGCLAYSLLTGRLLFEADSAVEILDLHRREPAPLASHKAPRPVPAALDALIADCLRKDPAERPTGAASVLRRLDALEVEEWSAGEARAWWDTFRPDEG